LIGDNPLSNLPLDIVGGVFNSPNAMERTIEISLSTFFGVMSILIGFVCLLLGAFLVAVPSRRKVPNRFLAAFLFLTALELSVWLWGRAPSVPDLVLTVWFSLAILQMPIFFFFFLASCYSDFRLKRHDILHLVPAAFVLLGGLITLNADPANLLKTLLRPSSTASAALSHVIYYGYMIAIVAILLRFRRRFRLHHAGGRSEVLIWLSQLAAASLFAHTVVMVRDVATFTQWGNTALALQLFGAFVALAVTTWIALISLLQPSLFRDVDRRLLQAKPPSAQWDSGELERVTTLIETNRPYLDPSLSLADLADQLAMTARELSELINRSLGLHFFDFVNGYRVEYAKTLLNDSPKRSVMEILHASGFNSKSSFNTAFKKHTGLTPTAYRA
jgi:AraC-like DNA-binding protein